MKTYANHNALKSVGTRWEPGNGGNRGNRPVSVPYEPPPIEHDPLAPPEAVIREMVRKVDAVALDMEAKWGRGLLPKLVSSLLASKFDAQANKLDHAVNTGLTVEVIKHANAMIRAWAALDAAAIEAGHKPSPAQAWRTTMEGGKALWIAKDDQEASKVIEKGATVLTVEEVGNLLSKDELGRLVIGVKSKISADVKEPPNWKTGDEIPF